MCILQTPCPQTPACVGCKAPISPGTALCTEGAESCPPPLPLPPTPAQAAAVHETPSPLALALSLPNNEQLLKGRTRDQKKNPKNPTHVLTRELQPSVLFGSCGLQHSPQSQGAHFPVQLQTQPMCLFISILDCKHGVQLKLTEYYFASEQIFPNEHNRLFYWLHNLKLPSAQGCYIPTAPTK